MCGHASVDPFDGGRISIFRGVLSMGGGWLQGITWNPTGGSYFVVSGQDRFITGPFTLALGADTFSFSFPALQGYGDEAFGLDNVSISANLIVPTGGAPEPASWALMIMGFGGIGAALRNRRRVFAAI